MPDVLVAVHWGMPSAPIIQDFYPDDFAHCYGCGRQSDRGLRLRSHWEGEEVVARFSPRPEHIAVPGFVYGGLLASLVDCHAMATAAAQAERNAGREIGSGPAPRFVTASLTVDYLRPTPHGPELMLRARATPGERGRMNVHVTLTANEVETVRADVVAAPLPGAMGRRP